MKTDDEIEQTLAEILFLATETRIDARKWTSYVERAGASARRAGLPEECVDDLPLMAASRAELSLRRAAVRAFAHRPNPAVASAERMEF